jgi:hypothetical protein
MSLSLFLCLSLSFYVYLSLSMSFSLPLFLSLSFSLLLCLTMSLSLCVFLSPFMCRPLSLSVCFSVSSTPYKFSVSLHHYLSKSISLSIPPAAFLFLYLYPTHLTDPILLSVFFCQSILALFLCISSSQSLTSVPNLSLFLVASDFSLLSIYLTLCFTLHLSLSFCLLFFSNYLSSILSVSFVCPFIVLPPFPYSLSSLPFFFLSSPYLSLSFSLSFTHFFLSFTLYFTLSLSLSYPLYFSMSLSLTLSSFLILKQLQNTFYTEGFFVLFILPLVCLIVNIHI